MGAAVDCIFFFMSFVCQYCLLRDSAKCYLGSRHIVVFHVESLKQFMELYQKELTILFLFSDTDQILQLNLQSVSVNLRLFYIRGESRLLNTKYDFCFGCCYGGKTKINTYSPALLYNITGLKVYFPL